MTALRLVRLAALAPYALAVFVPSLTATRALVLAWIVESGRPGPAGRRESADFVLRNAAPWLLLHTLRPDAAWWVGIAFLLFFALARPFWAEDARGRRGAALLVLLLLLPALLGFFFGLAGREAPALLGKLDPWAWASEPAAAVNESTRPEVAGVSDLRFELPPRLWPWALQDSPQRARALVAAWSLLIWIAAAALLRPGRRSMLLAGALAAAAIGAVALQGPKAMVVLYQEDAADGAARAHRLEVFALGGDLWDPARGDLLPPGRAGFQVRPADNGRGLIRVVSAEPWAVVLAQEPGFDLPEEPIAWLEVHPLRAPRSGGTRPEEGSLGILRLWAAGERGGSGKWLLDERGTLFRVPLP